MLLISKNMSTVKMADRIVVLDGGTVQEEGKHDELLLKGGLYAELVKNENMEFQRHEEKKSETH